MPYLLCVFVVEKNIRYSCLVGFLLWPTVTVEMTKK